jgi:two-component system response regulator MprA
MNEGWILVVDDDPDLRDLIVLLLTGEGYRSISAADGQAALETIAAHGCPRLILLDLRMPRMDGEAFSQAFRSCAEHDRVPIIILSGDCIGRATAARIGASFLAKPVDLHALLTAVDGSHASLLSEPQRAPAAARE